MTPIFLGLHERLAWQWTVSERPVLNIGCESDPAGLGRLPDTVNVDIDAWRNVYNFVQADACKRLPFADKSFDTVLLCECLDHMTDPRAAISEAIRLARRLVAATMPYYDEKVASEPPDHWITHIENLKRLGLTALAEGDQRHRHGHHHRWSKEDVEAMFAGFNALISGPHSENPPEWRIIIPP